MTKRFSSKITIGKDDMNRISDQVHTEHSKIGRTESACEVLSAMALALYTYGVRHASYKIFQGNRAVVVSHMTSDDKHLLKEYMKQLAAGMKVDYKIHKKGKLNKKAKEGLKSHCDDIGKVDPTRASEIALSIFEKYFNVFSEPTQEFPVSEKKIG